MQAPVILDFHQNRKFLAQSYRGDLRWNGKAISRSPIACSGIHIQLHAPMLVKATVVFVCQRHEQTEWEKLSGVRMTRKLEIVAQWLSINDDIWTMRQ
jgi:hypothetical protein